MLQIVAKFTFLHKLYSYLVKFFPIFFIHNNSKYLTIKKVLYNLNLDKISGDIIEFGVFTGSSFRHIINIEKNYTKDTRYYGLDSFEGFPESDHPFFVKNKFVANYKKVKRIENIVPNKIEIFKGFFSDVLEKNETLKKSNFKFVHLDCDLYISAIDPIKFISDKLVVGAYIMIDDFTNLDRNNLSIRNAFYKIFKESDIEKVGFFGIDGVVFRYMPKN